MSAFQNLARYVVGLLVIVIKQSQPVHLFDCARVTPLLSDGLLLLSMLADEYDPDEPLRIVARRQQTIRTRVTALPKFIIPSVGGNITSKAITQQQVAAITTLNPGGIGSIPCGEQSDVIDEEAAADEGKYLSTYSLPIYLCYFLSTLLL